MYKSEKEKPKNKSKKNKKQKRIKSNNNIYGSLVLHTENWAQMNSQCLFYLLLGCDLILQCRF